MERQAVTKRSRHACEPCRRKKSKCPGEKPTCSHCQRLRQRCYYSAEHGRMPSDTETKKQRMDVMESKMDRLLQLLDTTTAAAVSASPPAHDFEAMTPQVSETDERHLGRVKSVEPRMAVDEVTVDSVVNLYFTWCHKQPVALFREDTLRNICRTCHPSLWLALQSLSLRYPPDAMSWKKQSELDTLANDSRRQVMVRLSNNDVEISDIQTLCLISIIGFNNGKFAQAGLDLSTASHLVETFRIAPGQPDATELMHCVHAVTMLQHLQGTVVTLKSVGQFFTLDTPRENVSALFSAEALSSENDPYQHGLLKYTSELAKVWHMARSYAIHRPKADEPPPWFPQSDFSKVMMGHLKVDSTVPREFRYAANQFADQEPVTLQQQRQYWLPWLTVQMMYAAIPCLLNHPLLLSIRLRNFRDAMPQSFIQQSWEQITRHAGWIMHFVDLLETRPFAITEPSLAHCVVIVATIHLQHSFVQDHNLRVSSQEGFEKCLRFVREAGKTWPIVAAMADNLEAVRASVTPSARIDLDPDGEQESWSIDVRLLGRLLLFETAGQRVHETDCSLRSKTLIPKASDIYDKITRSADFNLIGSTGISGHRSAPKDTPISAPLPSARRSHGNSSDIDFFAGMAPNMPALEGIMDGPTLENATGVGRGANMFLPANEYGRAIDDWFAVDLI